MLKAIIDTNIWISALMKSSLTRPIVEAFIQMKFIPIISPELLKELHGALNKPKVAKLIPLEETKELITLINEKSQRLNPTQKVNICRDAGDNFIVSLLIEAKVPLVTLDKDLLTLKSNDLDIMPPQEFLTLLKKI